MADLITEIFRKYKEDGSSKARGTRITITKSKTDYSSVEREHPDNLVNQLYIDAGAADDHDWPLCFAVHDGEICHLIVRRGSKYCWKGRGDG